MSIFFHVLLYLRVRLEPRRGELSFWSIIAGLILVAAYLMFPQDVNHFFRYLYHYFFNALHDAFGTKDGKTGTATTRSKKHGG